MEEVSNQNKTPSLIMERDFIKLIRKNMKKINKTNSNSDIEDDISGN
jgi:hypothetical protein